ncbi:MAG: choice-of-anchor J domain-containing protein [Chitinophagaceae bacterium]
MNKSLFTRASICGLASIFLLEACNNDHKDVVVPPAPVTDQSFSQSFETLAAAQTQGWVFKNLSDNTGTDWTVRSSTVFYGDPAFDGTKLLYSNYAASTDVDGNISNWAISPARIIQNGDKISFYALSNGENDGYPDRIQLRLNVFNTSDSIGESSSDVGGFLRPLLDINQSYSLDPGGFPSTWTKYEATVSGLNKPDSGRFAIRYYLELNGGANGDEIAIDKVEYTSASHP